MLTVFSITISDLYLFTAYEGTTVPVRNLKMYIEWGYIPLVRFIATTWLWGSVALTT